MTDRTAIHLNPAVEHPRYNRRRQQRGIVHLGIGAFARAHQAVYTDDAMNHADAGWAITGVSLRSPTVRDQLGPQNGLFMVAVKSDCKTHYRLIAAVRNVLVAPEQPKEVIAAIADPQTRVVTLTVTEKGYGRGAGGTLDLKADAIVHDLAHPNEPRTIFGLLANGLARRRLARSGGMTLVSCDNLAGNGVILQSLMRQFLAHRDPALAEWFDESCRCPSTMVDRIVPATTEVERMAAEQATGLRDEGLVVTEPFRQWVVEDRFISGRPGWDAGGAQFVESVAPFEAAKLRMLNGAHSALAYLGLERSYEFVHQAIRDPTIRPLVERLMRQEAALTIKAAPGQDLDRYASDLLRRFENPALEHRLAQIAMDGSQKIPQRWLATLADNRQAGRECPAILQALGSWLRHVRDGDGAVDDPLARELKAAWDAAGETGIVDAVFGSAGLLPSEWQPREEDRDVVFA